VPLSRFTIPFHGHSYEYCKIVLYQIFSRLLDESYAFVLQDNLLKLNYSQGYHNESCVIRTLQRYRAMNNDGSTLGGRGTGAQIVVARPPNLTVLLTHCGQLILLMPPDVRF